MTTDYPGQVAPSRDTTRRQHRTGPRTAPPASNRSPPRDGRPTSPTPAAKSPTGAATGKTDPTSRPPQPGAPSGNTRSTYASSATPATSPPSGAPTATGPATDSDPAANAAPAANCSASTSSSQAISCHDPHVDHRHVRSYADRHAGLYADTRPVGARRGGVSDWFLRPGSAGQRDEPVGALGGFKRSSGWRV